MNWELVKDICMVLSIIFAVVGFILTILAKCKNKKIAEMAQKALDFITEAKSLITSAEQITKFDGEAKKEWVTTKLNEWCIKNNVTFDAEYTSQIIEDFVALTNKVNSNKSDKAVEAVKNIENEEEKL